MTVQPQSVSCVHPNGNQTTPELPHPRANVGAMVKRPTKTQGEQDTDTRCAESLPTLKAGREVGWFFLNGEAVAIERTECDPRASEDG
jgi:hypothetical protein